MRSVKSIGPWVWTGFVALSTLVMVLYDILNRGETVSIGVAGWLLVVLFTSLGSLIRVRQPGNRIAWLLLVTGAGFVLAGVLPFFVGAEPESPSFLDYVALVLDNWSGINLILYPLTLVLFLFPTGAFFTRRQAWAGWIGVVMVPTSLFVASFVEEIGPSFLEPDEAWTITNPVGFLPPTALDLVLTAWGSGLVFVAAFGVWSLIARYRRSSLSVRAQIRWMLFAASILVLAFVLLITTDTDNAMSGLLVALAFAMIPISITIAITRYRLFEIDRIISRTLSYTLVAGLLVAVYLGTVTAVTSLLPTQNTLAVAGSTLAVATLFNPLRKRIQHGVDRRFNRSGYQAEIVSEEFAAKLRESLTTEELTRVWANTVREALEPQVVAVWLNQTHTPTPTELPHRP